MLGPGWTSRRLQAVLAEMLTDPRSRATVAGARLTYRDRSERLSAALRREGLPIMPADGINLWLPVVDERSAEVSLASAGITVAAGSPFVMDGAVGRHLRVTAGSAEVDAAAVAGALAAAARAVLP
jgi:DNA-binding transcriptional MocR family regulator